MIANWLSMIGLNRARHRRSVLVQLQPTDQVLTAPESVWEKRLLRAKRWGATLAEFAFVQGLVQILTAVAGLLIVRTMAKHDYALYAIANSMLVTGNQLADLGIGIGEP